MMNFHRNVSVGCKPPSPYTRGQAIYGGRLALLWFSLARFGSVLGISWSYCCCEEGSETVFRMVTSNACVATPDPLLWMGPVFTWAQRGFFGESTFFTFHGLALHGRR